MAAVGILVNLVLLAPLGTHDLEDVVVSVRELLVRQLRQYAAPADADLRRPAGATGQSARGALALSVWACLEVFEREVADPPRAA